MDGDANRDEGAAVGALEGVERSRTDLSIKISQTPVDSLTQLNHLDCPVPSEQFVIEVDGHLGNTEVARNDEGPHQIISPVTASLEGGNLRAGHYDGLAKVLQHEGEGGGGVGQGVCTVEDHEPGNIEQLEYFSLQSRDHPTHQNCGS